MRESDLTLDRLKELLHYNPGTGEFTWKVNMRGPAKMGCVAGSDRPDGYRLVGVDGVNYRAHRLAWFYIHGKWPSHQIDHKNGIRNDNSIANLRDVPHIQNGRNQKKRCTNTSGVVGVSWCKRDRKWKAQIKVNHTMLYLGRYESFNDAVSARYAADLKHGFNKGHGKVLPDSLH